MGDLHVGFGFDVHPSDPTRELWLGGVLFPGEAGLAGHSDGDAVCHALADALLGAAALGDLGERFPEDDPGFEGIRGLDLLRRTVDLVREAGWSPGSCDVTIVCDRPSIAPQRGAIRAALADAVGSEVDRVSVKATRPEGLGLTGDGVGCFAVATLR